MGVRFWFRKANSHDQTHAAVPFTHTPVVTVQVKTFRNTTSTCMWRGSTRGSYNSTPAYVTATPRATKAAPVAWLGMEADSDSPGAGMTLRLWPEDRTVTLGRVDFHGRWLRWSPRG